MRNIEKSLASYVKGTGPKLTDDDLCNYLDKDANEIINIIFKIINDELDNMTGTKPLDGVRELINFISIILSNNDEIDRKIVSRKLSKLDEKIDRIKIENKNKFIDLEYAYEELELIRDSLNEIGSQTEEKDTKHYDFMSFLIDDLKDITYIEYTLNKLPSLVNIKDKNNISLFQNTIKNYINASKEEKEEDILYYSSVISLIMSKANFHLGTKEKRATLDIIYNAIDQFSIKKKKAKQNREKIEWLQKLASCIRQEDDRDNHIEVVANKYNISIYFEPELIEKARLVKVPRFSEEIERHIIDNEYIITIDGVNAIEIDDALSCRKLANGNYWLGVHIASVLGYFPYESDIVEEAINRTRTIYLPKKYSSDENDFNKAIPIFPYDFSARTASLLPGVPKLTRSYFYEIDSSGNIVREEFLKTKIKTNCKTTYKDIDKILESGTPNKRLENTVMNLQEVSELLEKNYSNGEEIYEHIKESVDDISDLRVKRVGAEKIVYQTMMLTGNRVAEFFADPKNGYPFLYRVHEVNRENTRKLQGMIDNLTRTYGGDQYRRLYQLIQGIYPRGWYASEGSHAGLGLDHYCHCTSGLRRAADIVVEHALEVCYDKNPTDKELITLETEIKNRANQINSKQNPIDWFIKDYKRPYQKKRNY